jgi:hypothetical protein
MLRNFVSGFACQTHAPRRNYEMFSCSLAFKELACSFARRSAVTLIFSQIQTSNKDVQEKD